MAFAYTLRTRNNFEPDSETPFKLSRSKIDLFLECPRCFYLDQRLGIKRPDTPPFSLNNAVDLLLKKEFDIHRAAQSQHPLLKAYKVEAVPYQHEKIEEWRDALRAGIRYLHEPTNLLVRGGIDDVWVDKKGNLIIVDYKATSKVSEVNIDAEWQESYKRQIEVYQWLFRQNDFKVSPIGYFVYVNGKQDRKAFDGKLEFDVTLIPYKGDTKWIEPTLKKIKQCLISEILPKPNEACSYCAYRKHAAEAANTFQTKLQENHEEAKDSKRNPTQESLIA